MKSRTKQLYDKILDLAGNKKLRTICDYGCGDGELLSYLNEHIPGLELYGIDYFSKFGGGEEETVFTKIDRDCDDFRDLINSRRFDLVISTHALHHFQYPVNELRTIGSMITPGGYLDLYDHCFDRDSWRGYSRSLSSLISEATSALRGNYHRHHFTLEEAVDLAAVISGEVVLQEEFRLEITDDDYTRTALKNIERNQGIIEKIKANWPQDWQDIFVSLYELDCRTIEKHGMDPSKMLHIRVKAG